MRLFFGLSLPDAIRDACAALAERCRERIPGRYALNANYHITLAFLGDVEPARVDEAADVLAACVRAWPAPRVTLGELSYFHRPENAVLVLRARAVPELEPLNEALRRALDARGLPADRGPFAPHITLARHARIAPGTMETIAPARGAFSCPAAHLFLSARDEAGVLRYAPLSCACFDKCCQESCKSTKTAE